MSTTPAALQLELLRLLARLDDLCCLANDPKTDEILEPVIVSLMEAIGKQTAAMALRP